MPLYEYECDTCHHQFELLVREKTTMECPACRGSELRKQLSVFAVGAPSHSASARNTAPAPCGSCGHPDGPGSCSVN